VLATFPDPEPARTFTGARCFRAVLRGAQQPIVIPRDAGERRGFLARALDRTSFWDLLMHIAESGSPRYRDYSYRDRADVYELAVGGPEAQHLRDASRLVRYTALEAQLRNATIESAELYVMRPR
jgi:hypothetical protein